MAYRKTNWTDRSVERPRTYTRTENADGSVTLVPAPGEIYSEGTPVNASNLRKPEDFLAELAAAFDMLGTITNAYAMALDKANEKLAQLTSRNLLQNSAFRINQRGYTTYSTASAYTVDRWRLGSAGGSLKVTDSGVQVKAQSAGHAMELLQILESPLKDNTDYTISIRKADGAVISRTVRRPPVNGSTASGSASAYAYLYRTGSYDYFVIRVTGEDAEIAAAKLEEGAACTIAAESPQSNSLELIECQRYYVKRSISRAYVTSFNNSFQLTVPLTVPMRTTPSVTVEGLNAVRFDGVQYGSAGAFTVSNVTMHTECLLIDFTSSVTIPMQRVGYVPTDITIVARAEP